MINSNEVITLVNAWLQDEATDEDVDKLQSSVWTEYQKRLLARIKAGKYAAVNDEEIALVKERNKIRAITNYSARNGVGIAVAKAVVEEFMAR